MQLTFLAHPLHRLWSDVVSLLCFIDTVQRSFVVGMQAKLALLFTFCILSLLLLLLVLGGSQF